MKEIRHDLNEASQMFTGAAWWLSQKNTTRARECINRGKELLEKADAELRTEELIEEVEVMEEMQIESKGMPELMIEVDEHLEYAYENGILARDCYDCENESVAKCASCGNPVCKEHKIECDNCGRIYCPECESSGVCSDCAFEIDDGQRCPHDYPDARDE